MFEVRYRHWKHGRRSVRTIKIAADNQAEAKTKFLNTVPDNQVSILSIFPVLKVGDSLAT